MSSPTGPAGGWALFLDTGGTFTDCLAIDPERRVHRAKVLSSSALRGRVGGPLAGDALRLAPSWRLPAVRDFLNGLTVRRLDGGADGAIVVAYEPAGRVVRLDRPLALPAGAAIELASAEEAPILAARLVTGTPAGEALPPLAMRLGTTRGTNALLERKGAAAVLFVTRGFADLLRIGTQQRPDLFALAIVRPAPLYREVIEVDERLAADGSILVPLTAEVEEELQRTARRLLGQGIEAAAVAFLHSYRNPAHEERVGELLAACGLRYVSLSSRLAPLIKILPRAETAVVDAYLSPVLERYLEGVARALAAGSSLHVMTSAGGLVSAPAFRPKDALLSGPAGGVVGAARAGRLAGFRHIIAFDMGGTSTDVA
ncbi:MAG TPA: hydantoinase/oxoprolinase N-terminal domain-containing protein, partial [Thermoanaerobaculia bacterium]